VQYKYNENNETVWAFKIVPLFTVYAKCGPISIILSLDELLWTAWTLHTDYWIIKKLIKSNCNFQMYDYCFIQIHDKLVVSQILLPYHTKHNTQTPESRN